MALDDTPAPTALRTDVRRSRDGLALAYYTLGPENGRTLLLIHGHTLSSRSNWIDPGHAALFAAAGYRVVAADLRGHGASDAPHSAAFYRPGALAEDLVDLVRFLGLEPGSFDIAAYSIGSRVTATALAAADGIRPGRVVLGGMGLAGLTHARGRGGPIRAVLADPGGVFPPGSFAAEVAQELPDDADRVAQSLIPDTNIDIPLDALTRLRLPVLVLMGDGDNECGEAAELAAVLPDARYAQVPDVHMRAFRHREFGEAILAFLGPPPFSASLREPAATSV